jgi:hypothetical protein
MKNEMKEGKADRYKTFNNEDPGPARSAAYAFHLLDSKGQETAKRDGNRTSGKENGCSDAKFRTLVPTGEVVIPSWAEACTSSNFLRKFEFRSDTTLEQAVRSHH